MCNICGGGICSQLPITLASFFSGGLAIVIFRRVYRRIKLKLSHKH